MDEELMLVFSRGLGRIRPTDNLGAVAATRKPSHRFTVLPPAHQWLAWKLSLVERGI